LIQISPRQILSLFAVALFFTLSLGTIYNFHSASSLESWQFIAVVNTVLGLVFLVARQRWQLDVPSRVRPWLWFLPSLLFLLIVLLAPTISRNFGSPTVQSPAPYWLAFVLWVPVVEELVFRGLIGRVMRRLGSPLWAGYFSALTFALMHTLPTWESMLAFKMGLPVGPLVLGGICEYLYYKSGKIVVPMLFHAVANFSVVVFSMMDSRWFDWLNFLYF
jgi:membrane protease YdiL (CAAX protease family)